MAVRRCVRCILPETFPTISFDADGVCNYCTGAKDVESAATIRDSMRRQIDELFEKARASRATGGSYDVIVAYSGGKDSTYTLKLLREQYDLNCLAVTIDNGFLSEHTFRNSRIVMEALGVDHIVFKPAFDFMKRLYQASVSGELQVKAAIKRASAICNSCINLVNAHMINVALQNGVSIIAGGYLGGQLPRAQAYLEINPSLMARAKEHELANYERHLGAIARNYFSLHGKDSAAVDTAKRLYVVNPLVAFDYDEDAIIVEISKLGWSRPNDTGLNSTNCMLNDVGIAIHQRRHGFHPYEADLAQLVREGRMDRAAALQKVESIPRKEDLQPVLDRLSLSEKQFGG
jgi:tRNA(Ile)-lysidine synthase TilS/MesJ